MLRRLLVAALLTLAQAFTPEVNYSIQDEVSYDLLYFDDAPVVLNLDKGTILRSEDSGKNWERTLEGVERIMIDPFKKDRAFAFTSKKIQYVSNDRGQSWGKFNLPLNPDFVFDLNVNSKDPNQIIVPFVECMDQGCTTSIYYTIDGFKSDPTILVKDAAKCVFTKSSKNFEVGEDSRVLCLKTERDSLGHIQRSQVIASNDFFLTEPQVLNDASGVLGGAYVLDITVVQSFAVAVVQADKYGNWGSSVFLYISKDSVNFHKAIMTETLTPNGFNLLPSTKNSLHIAVSGVDDDAFATANFVASDPEGVHFKSLLSHVSGSGLLGFLDIDKIDSVEGVWIATVLEGYNSETYEPNTRSKITFDDGNTWQYLSTPTCTGNEECGLNILSLQERIGNGQSTTGSTPGILLAIGSEGVSRDPDIWNLHTYVSRDGGWSWAKTLEEPCIFAFGDLGNVIVAAPYSKHKGNSLETKKLYYSLDQAQTWQTIELELAVSPMMLTTAIDGTTTNFLYAGLQGLPEKNTMNQVLYSLDFAKAFDGKTCSGNDFETWNGRSRDNDEGSCIFGHKDIYKRRRADAQCFVNKAYEDLKFDEVPCECTEADYDCSFGFAENSKGECAPDRAEMLKLCSDSSGKELTLQLKRKIPGNMCQGGNVQIKDYTFNCDDDLLKAESITTKRTDFEGRITNYYFLDQSMSFTTNDETLFVKTTKNEVYVSHDAGATFHKFDTDDEIVSIYLNPHYKDAVMLISAKGKVYSSVNRGYQFNIITLPTEINPFGLPIFTFAKEEYSSDRFIFLGDENCASQYSSGCIPVAYLTEDGGKTWIPLAKNARHCDFVGSRFEEPHFDPSLIFCQIDKGDKFELVSSTDNFANQRVLFDNMVGFAATTHFIIVAAVGGDSLQAHVTVDGLTFAEAHFPKDFVVKKQQAYTVLGSETGAIFLHVTSNERPGSEFGAILKSNANGTSYVMSERHVNRNEFGFVDHERVEGLEGIAIINTIKNYEEAQSGSIKQLQTRITFNDGSDWYYIQPPATDSEGKKYPCLGSPLQQCALHLHGYTERKDFRDTFSSGSAIGMLLAVGNVGDKLGSFKDASTFLTTNGGSTWKEVKKGVYQWEFGDRGSIITLVNDETPTNKILYSLDQGNSWAEYQFTDKEVKVDDIVTVPSDTSKKFLIVARTSDSRADESVTFTVDFEKVFTRQCILDMDHPDDDDFEFWTPSHELSSASCLFGHETQYLKKLADRVDCFIGNAPLGESSKIVRNCPCTRHDFECDYNYVKDTDGTCKLVDGLEPEDRSESCRIDQDTIEYFEPTGYRRIPMSTCEGGQQFDNWHPVPCPGKEAEFGKKRRGKLSGVGLALVIIIPVLVFAFAVWFVYDRGIRRNGGFSRFGEIRLGDEDDLVEQNVTDKVVNSIVRGGVAIIAGVIATYKMAGIINRGVVERFKNLADRRGTRFHSRGAYAGVGQDFRDDEDILGEVLDDEDYEVDDDEQAGHDSSEAYTDDRNLE